MSRACPNEADLVGLIYEAALRPERWPDLMQRFCDYLGGASGFTWRVDDRNHACGLMVDLHLAPEPLAAYAAHYHQFDPGLHYLLSRGEGTVTCTNQLVADRDFERTEYYTDCLRAANVFYCLGGTIAQSAGRSAVIATQRPPGSEPFGQADLDRLARLLPHLKRAAQIARQFDVSRQAEQVLADFMDGLPHGVVLLDDQGHIAGLNRRAQMLLGLRDGLKDDQGRVAAHHVEDRPALERAITQVVATGRGEGGFAGVALAVRRPSGLPPYQVLVTPLCTDGATLGLMSERICGALVIADEVSHPGATETAVQRWFGLTRAEARVALQLAEGLAPEEIAGRLGVSPLTVRTHLRNLYGKMGVTRQTQVVRKVLTGPLRYTPHASAAD